MADLSRGGLSGGSRRPILFVVEVPDDMKGGMSRQFRFVGEAIARKGHRVEYVFLDRMPRPLLRRLSGFTLDLCRRALHGVMRHLSSGEMPSLILWSVNTAFPFSVLRRHWPGVSKIPVVGMTFGVEERWWPQVLADSTCDGGPKVSWYHRFSTGWVRLKVLEMATKGCDHVICVSAEDRGYLLGQGGLPADKVTAISVGVEPAFLNSPIRVGGGDRILFVGTWIWRKGVKFLVEALSRVLRVEPSTTLSIVGAFQKTSVVLSNWPEDIRSRIRVVPEVDGTDMVGEYAMHDIFVLPSLFEGMPLSLAEAMAAGMAVVTTSTCGMRDLISHRRNGLTVPPRDSGALADAVLELVRDSGLRRRLGEDARRTMTCNTWDMVADRFLEVFEHAITSQQGRRVK